MLIEPLFTLGLAPDPARAQDRAVESVEMVGLERRSCGGCRTR
ncbi:MAG TPA: hypothetical protein VK878_06350 [Candidatus Deferrimicrobiaceae bacterium]|nr:hypothetical protein [Candidatus Deferrimicrobiaceae bacterium]